MVKIGNGWRGAACVGALALLAGCSAGSAEPGEPPVYESASNFSGPGSGFVGEPGIGSGEDYPTNNPQYSWSATRSAALVGESLVVFPGADDSAPLPYRANRGVLVYSLEDRSAPALVAELLVEGGALQLLAGTDYVTVVARVPRQLELSEIPTTPMFDDATLLMHVDLSDPNEPRLLASTELAGDFWQVLEQDGHLFVLSQVRRPAGQECEGGYETSSAATTETMRVTSYRFDGTSYELVDERDLPGDGYAAFGTWSAFVSVLGNYDENPTLSVASFSSAGEITVSQPVAVAGPVTAVDLTGTALAVATLTADAAQLSLFDTSDSSALSEQWSQPLPHASYRLSQTELLAEPVIIGNGWVLRQSGTEPPLSVSTEAYQLFAGAGDTLLAAERDSEGKVSLSSWSVAAPFALTRVSQLATDWPALEDDGSSTGRPFAWEATTQTLYYSFSVFDAPTSVVTSYVGLAQLDSGTLQALGDVTLADGGLPLVDAQGGQFVGSYGVQGVTAGPAPSAGPYLPFFGSTVERVIARRETDVGEFVLVQRGDDVILQYPAAETGDRREEALSHFASELVVEGGAIAAAGLYWNQDCGRDLDVPELELECPVPRQRGITFVSLSDPPGDPRPLPIDDSLNAPSLPDETEQQTSWFGYVRQQGRLLLPVTRLIRCHTAAVCDSLGFPWYTSFGVPGCNPQVEDCETKSFEPMQFVEGYGRESLLYWLDPATAETFGEPLRFTDDVDFQQTLITPQHEVGAPLDLSALVLSSDDVLGFPTDAPVYNSQGNSVTNQYDEALHRFGVELVRAAIDDVTLEASVNTPGRVVALTDAGTTIYSLVPQHLDPEHITALLHRLRVSNGHAAIQRSLVLGEGFRDAFASGPSIHFLLGPEAACYGASAERESTFFSVDVESFAQGPSLTLPWDAWAFDRATRTSSADSVVLDGGPAGYRGRAEIDVSADQPRVARYFTVPP